MNRYELCQSHGFVKNELDETQLKAESTKEYYFGDPIEVFKRRVSVDGTRKKKQILQLKETKPEKITCKKSEKKRKKNQRKRIKVTSRITVWITVT